MSSAGGENPGVSRRGSRAEGVATQAVGGAPPRSADLRKPRRPHASDLHRIQRLDPKGKGSCDGALPFDEVSFQVFSHFLCVDDFIYFGYFVLLLLLL